MRDPQRLAPDATTDAALANSEARFRRLLESAPYAVLMVRPDGLIEMVNSQAEALFGYARDELIGEPVEKLVPERLRSGDPGKPLIFFGDPETPQAGAARKFLGLGKDGTEFPVDVGLSAMETGEGTMILSAVVTRPRGPEPASNGHGPAAKRRPGHPDAGPAGDVRLDAAFANVPHGLCMFDADKRLILSNARYAEMYGLPLALTKPGTPLADIIAFREKAGNAPVDFPTYASHEGINFKQEGNSLFEFMLADGRTIRINHLVVAGGGYVATHEDITDTIRSEGRFRSIFDAVGDGIFILDAATVAFIEVNAPGSAMLGYEAAELIGADVQALASGVAPYTRTEIAERVGKATASGKPLRFAWQTRSRQGRTFPVEVSMRSAAIGGQAVVLAIVRDLTEREAIESQLRQSQKMEAIGQLTGGMAHDFNNLLGVIIGNLELLREARPDDALLTELSGEALDAALGGADLTRRLLAFARRQPLQPERIDLNDLVARTIKLLKRVLGENIEISLDLADPVYPVVADPAQLEAALTNLATNARDAMGRGGKLLVATGVRTLDADYVASHQDVTAGEYALIEVTDTGSGMTPEVMSHIFDPFFTTKARDKGTGLGLSMVFGFLKQSGGHVSVYSEVGVGTTFRLYLPRADGGGKVEAAPDLPGSSQSQGETVLVVEDNAPLRRAAVQQLRELGYAVREAGSASEALKLLDTIKADLLFTDIVMPGGVDGFELARIARARWPNLKVILTSGYPEGKMKDDLAGADYPLLNKPYRKAALARLLREVLDPPASGGG